MKRTDLAALLFLFALAVVFFAPVLFGNTTLVPFDNLYRFPPWSAFAQQNGVTQAHNPLLDDLVLENYAWKNFINESIRAGEIPLWNPYILGGQPFLAAGQNATLYPFSILFILLPLARAYALFALLHYWLAACAMYLLGRVLKLRPFAALISGIVYAFGGFMVVSVVFPMVVSAAAWLPAIIAFTELTLREEEKRRSTQANSPSAVRSPSSVPRELAYALITGILIGVQFLAGHVEVSYYILLVLAFYAAWRILGMTVSLRARTINFRALVRAGLVIVAIVALGLLLAAIQIIPLYELVSSNFRAGSVSYGDVAGWALPSRQVLTFFIPDFFGNPTAHSYFDIYDLVWRAAPQDTIFWGVKNYVEAGAYVGILAMVLAVLGIIFAFRSRSASLDDSDTTTPTRFFTVLTILALLFAFGTPLYAILFYGLPGWNQLHTAFRWIFPWTLSIAYLAGVGAQAISSPSLQGAGLAARWSLSPQSQTDTTSQTRRPNGFITLIGIVLTLAGVLIFTLIALSLVLRDPFLRLADTFVNASDLAKPVFETGQAFWSYEARNIALFGLFILLAGIVLLVARKSWQIRNVALWKPLALLVIVADVFIAGMGFYPRADIKLADFVPPSVQFLQQDKSLYRITSYDVRGEKTMNANSAMPFDIQDIRGYDSIIAKQYVDYMQLLAPQDELLYNRIAAFYDYQPLKSPLLNLVNVKYILTTRTVPFASYPLVYDGEIKIYQNPNVLPRAFLVNQARVIPNRADLLSALPALDAKREVLLETAPLKPTVSSAGENALPTVEKYTGSEVVLTTNTTQPTYLVLTDTYFPGWIGQIDGEDTPIYRADGNFRAVQVPAGQHTVRFKYSPISFRVGSVLSLLTIIGVMLAIVALIWQRFVLSYGEEEGSQVRTVAKNSLVPMGASLLIQVINFALALVVLRVLGPANNGKYAFAVTVWFFLSAITEFGLGILTTREVSRDRSKGNVYLTNAIVMRFAFTALSIVLLGAVIAFYHSTGNLDSETIWAMLLLWLSLFPNHVAGALSGLFFAYERFEYPTAIEIATALVSVALQIAVLLAGYGIVGLAGVSIVTNIFTLLVMWYLVRRLLFKPHFAFDRSVARWMFFESYPLMLNNLLANLFFKIDVFLLLPLAGDKILGFYNAAYKFVNALNFIPSKFTLAIFPLLSRSTTGGADTLRRALILSVKLLTWIAVPITVATVFIAPQLMLLFAGPAFLPDSAIALQWLIFFMPFSFINSVVHYVLIALNEQRFLTRAFLIGLVFNIAANLIAIPPLTYRGAALVTVLSELALLAPFYYALRKHMEPLPILDIFWRPALAGAVMGGVLYLLVAQNILVALTIATPIYAVILVLSGALGADEWLLIQRLVPKRFESLVGTFSRAIPGISIKK